MRDILDRPRTALEERYSQLAKQGRLSGGHYGGRNAAVGDIIRYLDGSRAVVVSAHEATHRDMSGAYYSCGWAVDLPEE